MKRHRKLIFEILKYVESAKANGEKIPLPEFDDYNRHEVEYHVKLCEEAGYVDLVVSAQDHSPEAIVRLTWNGHNALDRLRKEGCCQK